MNVAVGTGLNDNNIDITGIDNDVWITVELGDGRPSASVHLIRTDEGIVVDVWPGDDSGDEPIASTYAFDEDLTDPTDIY